MGLLRSLHVLRSCLKPLLWLHSSPAVMIHNHSTPVGFDNLLLQVSGAIVRLMLRRETRVIETGNIHMYLMHSVSDNLLSIFTVVSLSLGNKHITSVNTERQN